jgi:hypothetical protein
VIFGFLPGSRHSIGNGLPLFKDLAKLLRVDSLRPTVFPTGQLSASTCRS